MMKDILFSFLTQISPQSIRLEKEILLQSFIVISFYYDTAVCDRSHLIFLIVYPLTWWITLGLVFFVFFF